MKKKKVPMRRCIGCMESKPKKELIRIAACDGELLIDLTGKAPGRGIYVCPCEDCIEKVVKTNLLKHGLKANISRRQLEKLSEELELLKECDG